MDAFFGNEPAHRGKEVFPVIDPYDKDPADLSFRILHIFRFPPNGSYGLRAGHSPLLC
jgi:hypothetical protein